MILLGVDTSTRWASVGLQDGDGKVWEKVWRSEQNHGRELMPAVMEALETAGLNPDDVTSLAVTLGPGGFSAVRVGISAVIGLSAPADLPIVGIPTHSVEAEAHISYATPETPLLSVIPAGRGELSWARFESDSALTLTDIGLCSVEDFVEGLPANSRVCGEAAEALAGKVSPETIVGTKPPTRKPDSLLRLAKSQLENHGSTPQESLRPIYSRPPSISKPNPPK